MNNLLAFELIGAGLKSDRRVARSQLLDVPKFTVVGEFDRSLDVSRHSEASFSLYRYETWTQHKYGHILQSYQHYGSGKLLEIV